MRKLKVGMGQSGRGGVGGGNDDGGGGAMNTRTAQGVIH